MLYRYRFVWFRILPIIILLTFSIKSQGQCPFTVAFTFEKDCSQDFTIDFDNNTTPSGSVNYYVWDFGNGATSTAPHPTYTYALAGTYTVWLKAVGNSGCADSISWDVEVSKVPNVTFNWSQTGCGEITFDNLSTDYGSNPVWEWDFDDGSSSSAFAPVYAYTTGGPYQVTLTLDFDSTCTYTDTKFIFVVDPIVPGFTYTTDCSTVTFTDTSSGTGLSYSWNFGDPGSGAANNVSTDPNPVHTFSSPGQSYTVTLTISDQYCTGISTSQVLVFPNLPVANFSFSPDGQCSTTPIDFNASTSTGGTLTYDWDFGDGNFSLGLTTPSVQYTYNSYFNAACDPSQSYTALLTITDEVGCTDTHTEIVNTQRIPDPQLSAINGTSFQNCHLVTPGNPLLPLWVDNITPNMTCIDSLEISWGDGTPDTTGLQSSDFPLYHEYAALGEYALTITAYGWNGCTSSKTYEVVNQINPDVGITNVGSISNCGDDTITFVLTGYTQNTPGTYYVWNFDDGEIVYWNYNEPYINDTIKHFYSQSHCENSYVTNPTLGYEPTVSAINACGSVASSIKYVKIYATPEARFIPANSSEYGCLGIPFCFTNTTLHGYGANCTTSTTYTWDFGDGTISNEISPCYTYAYPGTYQVTLEAENEACGKHDTTLTIYITGVHVDFIADTVCLGDQTQFSSLAWAYDDSTFQNNPAISITGHSWNFGGTGTSTLPNPNHIFPDTGIYMVTYTATSEYGCDSTITLPIYVSGLFIDNIIIDSISCFGEDDGSISVTTTGGMGNVTYTLNPINNTNTSGTFGSLGPGSYWIVAVDELGCSAITDTINLIEPLPITIDSIQYLDISCNNANDGEITVFVSGGTTPLVYTLLPSGPSNGSGFFDGLSAGSYRVVVEDANNCPSDTSNWITIANPPPIIIDSVHSVDILCNGDTTGYIQAWAQGGTGTITYTINGGLPNTSGIFDSLSAGTYIITATDENSCDTSWSNIMIAEPPPITFTYTYNDISCHDSLDGAIYVSASGGTGIFTYTLKFMLMPLVSNATGTFTGLAAGNYYVVIEDENACADSTANITIINPDEVLITNEIVTPITCYNADDGIIEISATGGTSPYLFSISPPVLPPNSTGIFNSLTPGSYYVIVEDANGCPSDTSSIFNFINPPELIIDSIHFQDIICHDYNNGWIQIYASGGTGTLNYTLSTGGPPNTTGYFDNLAGNTYTVDVTDSNNCLLTTIPITIVNPPGVTVNVSHTDITCFGDNDGTITISASGGIGLLEYSIDNGFTYFLAGFFPGLTPGTYVARVRDANGCETTGIPVNVIEPPLLQIGGFIPIPPTCSGCSDGSITANVTGGTPPYSHSWSNGMTGNPITGIPSGWYTDTVTDANGCQTLDSVFLNEPGPLTITMDSANVLCYGGSSGWVAAIPGGGTAPYSYEWTKVPSGTIIGITSTLFNRDAGFYTVTVYDFFNNIIRDTIEVAQPDSLALTMNHPDTLCFGFSSGWATVVAVGGIPPYSYSWNAGTGVSTDSIYNIPAGTYIVTVTDSNNCQTTDQITIIENPELTVLASASDTVICSSFTVQLNATPTGGTQPISTYLWLPATGLSNPNIQSPLTTPTVTTTYTVLITDQRGCTALDSVTINVFISPTADFTYLNPCASNLVNFFDQSVSNGDSIVSWDWSFGDGYFSNLINPAHTYENTDTTYTVTLIVTNYNGCSDTIIQNVYVNPMIGLLAWADTACLGQITQFHDSATNPLASIISWSWDFGDGNTASIPNPQHTYVLPGIYNVNLFVVDSSACTEATSFNINVYPLPVPDFIDSTSCIDNTTYFTDLSDTTITSITSWSWDFGDGNVSVFQHPSHLYLSSGTYQVTLAITNTNGCVDSITKAIVVFPRPDADFIVDTVCVGYPSHYTDLSTSYYGVIDSWQWDFGDGMGSSTQQNPIYTYSSPGFYNVRLVVGNTNGCFDTTWQLASVLELPLADFTFDLACEFNPTTFTDLSVANSVSLASWFWDFGDGFSSNLQSPQHTFPAAGFYTVQLTVTNSNGCIDDTTMIIGVDSIPTADFTYSPSMCANDSTFFIDVSIPNAGSLISWLWDFGDGYTSTLQHPSHVFAIPGLYTVSLTVTNSNTCTDSASYNINVQEGPTADFTAGPACINVPTEFFDQSSIPSGQIISWDWDFGDPASGMNNVSNLQHPAHTYISAGQYFVRLIVTDNDFCHDTIIQEVNVYDKPVADYLFALNCHHDATAFIDISTAAASPISNWLWDFGDGTTINYSSYTDSVFHTYINSGQYQVTLTVTDTNGCTDSEIKMIMIFSLPTALFAFDQTCVNNITHFTDYSNGAGADIVSWYWDFGDPVSGAQNYSSLQNPTHQYAAAGNYFVTLHVVNDNGCENMTTQVVTISPGPVADFIVDSVCAGFPSYFQNLSYAIGENIISWYWEFGDGATSILQFPYHTYANAGTYFVSLTVVTNNGCVDNVVKPVIVNDLPVADFDYNLPNCHEDSTYFTDLSWFIGGNIINHWHWDFGDGTIDTINQNPVHHYVMPGNYSVSLTIYDTNGCYNSVIKDVYVNPKPLAGFNYQTYTCDTVYFTDLSVGVGDSIIAWYWDFGDPASGWNNYSTLQNPMHVYINSDTYNVTLVVTDALGCTDTLIQIIDVYKPVADFEATESCANSVTQFTDLSYVTGDVIVGWLWDFGDGATSIASNPVHIYTLGGIYYVTLTVTSSQGCVANVIKPIEVLWAPTADFEFNTTCFGDSIQFTDLSYTAGNSQIASWDWDFGDGNISNVQNPVHTYLATGSYTISLIVHDTSGCFATISRAIVITEGPQASFLSNIDCYGQTTQFIDQSTTNGLPIIEWYWDFGDPLSGPLNNSFLQSPVHVFSSPGIYNVTLIVWDLEYCNDTIIKTLIVHPNPPVDYFYDAACEGELTQFYVDDSVVNVNTIISYLWDFGDGGFSTLQNPLHLFTNWGTFNVTLTITDTSLCENSITKEIIVDKLPIAFFDISEPTCNIDSVFFTDLSSTTWGYIETWIWDFDDGSPLDTIHFPDDPNIYHVFDNPGIYGVTLTVINSQGCSHSLIRPTEVVAKPIANFHWLANPCQNEIVQFNDASFPNGQGNIVTWHWDFDDPISGINNTSVMQNPQHIFTEAGTYYVELIVINFNDCSDTIVKPVFVNESPEVDFTWDTPCEDTLTYFYPDSSVMNLTSITSWLWDFGDGQYSSDEYPAHYYENSGYYTVTLTVVDTGICTNSKSYEILVNTSPIAFFEISEHKCKGDPVYFEDLSSVPASFIIEWTWDFGDGTDTTILFPDDPDVYHTYQFDGTYIVSLLVKSDDLCYGIESQYLSINPSPIALFNTDPSCFNVPTQFWDNSSLGGGLSIISWEWNFGDPQSGSNNTSNLQNPLHTFSNPGLYNVSLAIINADGCSDSIISSVFVNDLPDVDFSWSMPCEDTLTYFYPDSTIMSIATITSWHWDFGDGNYSSYENPAHKYENSGYYNVTLTVVDTGLCSNNIAYEVFVKPSPIAFFDVSDLTCSGEAVYFEDLSSVPNSYIVEWQWDFGDGNDTIIYFPDNPNVNHTYASNGSYIVSLNVISADSCYGFDSQTLIINPSPIALFNYEESCVGLPVQFWDNSSTGGGAVIISWEWNFGDPQSGANNTSTLQNPVHVYNDPGIYDASLNITNADGCTNVVIDQITIFEETSVDYYFIDSCQNILTQFFVDPSLTNIGAIALFDWDFGDGSSHSSNMNPTHMYGAPGLYNVILSIYDTLGCYNSVEHEVEVRENPTAQFDYEAACKNDTALFTDESFTTNGDVIIAWKWDFGDPASGSNNISYLQDPMHAFSGTNTYIVKLVVTTDYGCKDSVMVPIIVNEKPVAQYGYNIHYCEPGKVNFWDESTSTQSMIVAWEWHFEPAAYSTLPDPLYYFDNSDTTYNVSLIITDANGCDDEITKSIYIPPALEIAVSNTQACHQEPMSFSAYIVQPLQDSIFMYEWNFGEPLSGPYNTSNLPTPQHTYLNPGTYYTTLRVVDIFGCEVTVLHEVYVDELPSPSFEYSGVQCDSTLYFTDQSLGNGAPIESWLWSFGDGTPSVFIDNPPGDTDHFYQSAGIYNVTLTVTNTLGCENSISMEVEREPCLNSNFIVVSDTLCARNIISFADSSTVDFLIEKWSWDFGDGHDTTYYSKSEVINHFYADEGYYEVTLIVSATFNNYIVADTFTSYINVRPTPFPDFTSDAGCFGDISLFYDDTYHPGSTIESWHWIFGTGNSSDTSRYTNPSFEYDFSGTYNVTLTTINNFGCLDTITKEVLVAEPPKANFKYSTACVKNEVLFTDLSDGFGAEIVHWEWYFNDPHSDGDSSVQQNPIYTYEHLGTNLVRLIATNENGCTDTISRDVTVLSVPIADFAITDNYQNLQGSVLLEDYSEGALEYLWNFGDGDEEWNNNPPVHHMYEYDGEYIISLTVWNENGCVDSIYKDYGFMFKTLFIPNALCPACVDPEVKIFKPKGMNLKSFYIAVHDTWGNLIWESNELDEFGSPTEYWDGTLNGELLPTDVYIWYARAMFLDGTFWEGSVVGNKKEGSPKPNGTVTLVR